MFIFKKDRQEVFKDIQDLKHKVQKQEETIARLRFMLLSTSKFDLGDCVKNTGNFNYSAVCVGPYKIIGKDIINYYQSPYSYEWQYECINDRFYKITLLEKDLELNREGDVK